MWCISGFRLWVEEGGAERGPNPLKWPLILFSERAVHCDIIVSSSSGGSYFIDSSIPKQTISYVPCSNKTRQIFPSVSYYVYPNLPSAVVCYITLCIKSHYEKAKCFFFFRETYVEVEACRGQSLYKEA